MAVKVKSLEKCKELGYDGHFVSTFCGNEVEIKNIGNGNFIGEHMDYCEVKLKSEIFTQSIPIQFLKKIKSADNINKNDDIDLSSGFIELAKIIKHKKENGENCDEDLKKLSEIIKSDIDNILGDMVELTEEEKLTLGY
jgi:hypothetical protein